MMKARFFHVLSSLKNNMYGAVSEYFSQLQQSNRKEDIRAGAVHMGRAGKGSRGSDITKKV